MSELNDKIEKLKRDLNSQSCVIKNLMNSESAKKNKAKGKSEKKV